MLTTTRPSFGLDDNKIPSPKMNGIGANDAELDCDEEADAEEGDVEPEKKEESIAGVTLLIGMWLNCAKFCMSRLNAHSKADVTGRRRSCGGDIMTEDEGSEEDVADGRMAPSKVTSGIKLSMS